jgi:glycosyltransferase involved in cell wall biosynthesis
MSRWFTNVAGGSPDAVTGPNSAAFTVSPCPTPRRLQYGSSAWAPAGAESSRQRVSTARRKGTTLPCPPVRVHQLLSGAGPVDAVTRQALGFRELFAGWGIGGEVHAAAIEPRLNAGVRPLERLDPAADDVLLIHYSAYAPRLEQLLELPNRKLLVYHNVTPARYLWSFQPHVAALCELGRDHLPRYAAAADVAIAVSEYNARELREAGADDVRIVPILFEPQRLGPGDAAAPDPERPLIVSVGRVAPHKRHDLMIRAFALFQRELEPAARLVCAGEPIAAAYAGRLRDLADRVGARGVELPGALAQERLNAVYREAAAALYLSEHEGFCIPLLEAFHFGIPVVARPAGGMPEVAGDAALWTDEDADPAIVAELLALAVRDSELRETLAVRGGARLDEFAPERTAAKLREAVGA